MNDTGYGDKYFHGISQRVHFLFQLALESEVIVVAEEILFATYTVPCFDWITRVECFRVILVSLAGKILVRVGDNRVVGQSSVFVIDEVEVAQIGMRFVTIRLVTAEKTIAQQFVAVILVISATVDIVQIATNVDLRAEVHGQCAFQSFVFTFTSPHSRVHYVCVRDFCIVILCVLRVRYIIIVSIGKQEIARFLAFGKDTGLCR